MDDTPADKRVVLVPRYLSRFTCLGSACEDNCCTAGWAVAVDAATFGRYQALDHELGPALRQHVVPNPPARQTPGDFARIQLDSAGTCPFLTADRMCGVQRALGPDLLSDVCLSYPRRTAIIQGTVERGAFLSCPEIARLALLDDRAMDLVAIDESTPARAALSAVFRSAAGTPDDGQAAVASVRRACGDLARARDVSLAVRLVAVGLLFRGLSVRDRVSPAVVEGVFQSCADALPAVARFVAHRQPAIRVTLEVLWELFVERLAAGGAPMASARFRHCVDRMALGLRLRPGQMVGEMSAQRLAEASREHYQPFLRAHPSFLENYVVSQLHGTPFPFLAGHTPLTAYVLLVARAAMLRLMLIGVSACEGGLTDELAVEVVQSFERALGHDPSVWHAVAAVLRRNRLLTLAFAASLLPAELAGDDAAERVSPARASTGQRIAGERGSPASAPAEPRMLQAELDALRRATRRLERRWANRMAGTATPPLLVGLTGSVSLAQAGPGEDVTIEHDTPDPIAEGIRGLRAIADGLLATAQGLQTRVAVGSGAQDAATIQDPIAGTAADWVAVFGEKVRGMDDQLSQIEAEVILARSARDRAALAADDVLQLVERLLSLLGATTGLQEEARAIALALHATDADQGRGASE